MSTSAVDAATRAPDDIAIPGGSDRLPAIRSELDRLLDLAEEFEGRPTGGTATTVDAGPTVADLLPVPVPAPPAAPSASRRVVWALVASVGLLVLVAAGVVTSAWLERWFGGDDGPRLAERVELGPAGDDVDGPAVDGPESDAAVPATDPADAGTAPDEPAPDEPGSGAPAPAVVDPAACGAADLLAAAQALAPEVPLALTDKRCEGPYAVVGLVGAPVEAGPAPMPPGWAAFRFDGEAWQRLSGGFSVDGWVDVCRATVWSDPAFPLALCG